MSREEDLSAVEARPQAAARVSGQDGDGRRPQGDRSPPGARPQAPLGLTSVPPSAAIGRLTRRPEFQAAAAEGRRFNTERMSLQGRRRAEQEVPEGLRVGLTLTRKVGHATERNRIKRRLRVALRQAASGFRSEPADIVVIGRRAALAAPFSLLVEDLGRAIQAVMRPRPDGAESGSGRPQRKRGRDAQRR